MSAIAYVTDSKMLELHRLNNHETMNFWRLSNNVNFSDFGKGDLVFFLSKDKEHKKRSEKGIVGFGRVTDISVASVKTMWERHGIYNGYNSLNEFKEAILRVSKDRKLPSKISSSVESYIYLKPEEVVISLLDLAKQSGDLWSDFNNNREKIEREKLLYSLFAAHEKIGDIPGSEKGYRKATRVLKAYAEEHPEYRFIRGSRSELYCLGKQSLDILIYEDKDIDRRTLIGQAQLYRYYLGYYYHRDVAVRFLTSERNEDNEYFMNALL